MGASSCPLPIWHPFTQMKDLEQSPNILIKKAKGLKIWDNKDNWYYDTISSWWCNLLGHNHPKINKAIKKQLRAFEHVLFAGFTHQPALDLAEKLVKITPPALSKIFFSDNGSTAVEVALKMSYQYWQQTGKTKKKKFICLENGYHGDTLAAMSVSGKSAYNKIFKPLCFETIEVPVNNIKALEKVLTQKNSETCAFILEPLLMGAGGMIMYPKDYLEKAAQLTKKYNVHLILDEIATGFGRTGKMFAFEHCAGVVPDFLCLSKALTGGYLPLSATITTKKIFQAFYADYEEYKTFFHGHTYTANPLACAAANATLDMLIHDNLIAKSQPRIKQLAKGLEKFNNISIVNKTRQIGLVGAIELKETGIPRLGYQIYQKALKQHLILRPLGNVIYFFLPLTVKKQELEYILKTTYELIKNKSKYGSTYSDNPKK
ncbi:adenosylmethionine--8-amino-7-oxononanoate transaminase [Candidatus Margulisiibacteriota bacterium]